MDFLETGVYVAFLPVDEWLWVLGKNCTEKCVIMIFLYPSCWGLAFFCKTEVFLYFASDLWL